MPALDLRDLSPGAAYVRVLGIMYAPGSTSLRRTFEEAMRAQGVIHAAERLAQHTTPGDPLDPSMVQRDFALLAAAAQAPRLETMAGQLRSRGGQVSAKILSNVLYGATMEQSIRQISEDAAAFRGFSRTKVRRSWDEFRPVAHAWLAHILTLGIQPIPAITPSQMLDLIGTADAIRRRAVVCVTGTRAVPLLDPVTTWTFRLPDGVNASPVGILLEGEAA